MDTTVDSMTEKALVQSGVDEFVLMGGSHQVVLMCTLVASLVMVFLARRGSGLYPFLARGLACLLLLHFPLRWWLAHQMGQLNFTEQLPLELCNLAQLVAAAGLLFRKQRLAEFAWFWGLAGTLQAVLTPDLSKDFPDLGFLLFFLSHCGIITAAFALVCGEKFYPRKGSAIKCWLWTQLYFWPVFWLNLLFKWNYGYLREKPAGGSLLDIMGDWPIYLIWLQGLSLLIFILLELPFRRRS